MIRREIEFPDCEKLWLLVSQVEHAHISGKLTQHSKEKFSTEVVEAITHHDDGWSEWETAPRLKPEIGGPYSFTEMPLAEALLIWDESIAAARKLGPLGGFIVAGHFYNLLAESEHGKEPAAIAWLAAKRKFRTAWLDEWVRLSPANTLDVAKQAQHQLFLTDLFSLWLCCDCPIADEVIGDGASLLEQSAMKQRTKKLLGQFNFSVVGFGRRHVTLQNPLEALAWVVTVDPYPFAIEPLSLRLMADVVPVAHYANWQELKAASRPMEVHWRLIPPVQPGAATGGESNP
jgi:hypothetical protein